MTSMLLRLSICGRPGWLLRLLDGLGHHLRIGLEPVRDPRPLAAPHLPDLHQASALVVRGRDLERRHQASEREASDLLEPLLPVLGGERPKRWAIRKSAR